MNQQKRVRKRKIKREKEKRKWKTNGAFGKGNK